MLGDLDKSIQNIAGVTGSTSDGLTGLQKTLSNSAELLNEASGKLTSLAATLSSEDSKDLSAVTNLLSEDPETIASFLSSPVKLDEKRFIQLKITGLQ